MSESPGRLETAVQDSPLDDHHRNRQAGLTRGSIMMMEQDRWDAIQRQLATFQQDKLMARNLVIRLEQSLALVCSF
jgi:hypothetical protein